MSIPTPPHLPGTAEPGNYLPISGDGEVINDLNSCVFPIVAQADGTRWRLIGTGFYITDNGIFLSAKHVLTDVFVGRRDPLGPQSEAIAIVQFLPGNHYILRPILRASVHNVADVGAGVAAAIAESPSGPPFKNKLLRLTTRQPEIGSAVATLAYPRVLFVGEPNTKEMYFYSDYYAGVIEVYYPSGRDKSSLPAPCFQTSMHIHGGASGGPVFGADGLVFGINSTGWEGEPLSFVSRIEDALSLKITDVTMPKGPPRRDVLISELAEEGFVSLHPRAQAKK